MLCFLGYVSFFVHMLYHLSLRSMCIFLSSSKSKSIHFPSNHHVTPCPVTPSMHQPRSSWRGVVKPGGAGCSGDGCGSTKPGLLQKDVGQACLHLLALVQFFFSEGDLLPRGPLHMITGAWPPFEIAEYFWTKQVLLNWGFQR